MLLQEIDEHLKENFEDLPMEMQEEIYNSVSCCCEISFNINDTKDLMYVNCRNGKIRWWHNGKYGRSC